MNETTDEVLWSMAPPAKIATMTTTIDDSIAAKICVNVLFTLNVQVIHDLKKLRYSSTFEINV